MSIKESFLSNAKKASIIILSAVIAYLVSIHFSGVLLKSGKYGDIIWLVQTTCYSVILNVLFDWAGYILYNSSTIVEFEFSNKRDREDTLTITSDKDYKTIILTIKITGIGYPIKDEIRIVEPAQLTIQFSKPFEFIKLNNGYYEVDLNNIMGFSKDDTSNNKKRGISKKRTCEFMVTLDDYENDYEDRLGITRIYKKRFFKTGKLKINENNIVIRGQRR